MAKDELEDTLIQTAGMSSVSVPGSRMIRKERALRPGIACEADLGQMYMFQSGHTAPVLLAAQGHSHTAKQTLRAPYGPVQLQHRGALCLLRVTRVTPLLNVVFDDETHIKGNV